MPLGRSLETCISVTPPASWAALVLHTPREQVSLRRAGAQAPGSENIVGGAPCLPRWKVDHESPRIGPVSPAWLRGGLRGWIPWPAQLGVPSAVNRPPYTPLPCPFAQPSGQEMTLPSLLAPLITANPGINLITRLSPRGWGMEAPHGIPVAQGCWGGLGSQALPAVPSPHRPPPT